MNIAFASSDAESVNCHFGHSKSFYLYAVGKNSSQFLGLIDTSQEPEDEKEKLEYKIAKIANADLMYCTQIGPTASKMIQAAGVHPVRVAEGENIVAAIMKLQEMLNDAPPPWLLRIYHRAQKE